MRGLIHQPSLLPVVREDPLSHGLELLLVQGLESDTFKVQPPMGSAL